LDRGLQFGSKGWLSKRSGLQRRIGDISLSHRSDDRVAVQAGLSDWGSFGRVPSLSDGGRLPIDRLRRPIGRGGGNHIDGGLIPVAGGLSPVAGRLLIRADWHSGEGGSLDDSGRGLGNLVGGGEAGRSNRVHSSCSFCDSILQFGLQGNVGFDSRSLGSDGSFGLSVLCRIIRSLDESIGSIHQFGHGSLGQNCIDFGIESGQRLGESISDCIYDLLLDHSLSKSKGQFVNESVSGLRDLHIDVVQSDFDLVQFEGGRSSIRLVGSEIIVQLDSHSVVSEGEVQDSIV